jgi:tetratricopeptide (TPR) repeat protein
MHRNRIAGLTFALVALIHGRSLAGTPASQARQLMDSGVAHERLGQHQTALGEFTQALALKALSAPDRVRAIFDRGVALDALGRTKDAIRDYSDAARLDSHFAPALNNRANAYRRLGKLNEAKRDYLAALACSDVAREYPYYGLAQIAQATGDSPTARDYYNKALAANPTFALAAQSLAVLSRETTTSAVSLRPPPALHLPPQPSAQTTPFVPPPARQMPAAQAQNDGPKPAQPVTKALPGTEKPVSKPAPEPALRAAIVDRGSKSGTVTGAAQIQLGAFRDQASATEGWNKIIAAADGALDGRSPNVIPVDLPGKGRYYRLRISVEDKKAAAKLCSALVADGISCLPVRD